MLEVIGQTLQATVSLLDVRAKLLLRHTERAAVALLWKAAAAVCIGVAVLIGLAAGAIAAAPVWGWPAVLGVGAGTVAIAGLIAWSVGASKEKPVPDPETQELEREAAHWQAVIHPPKPAKEETRAGGNHHAASSSTASPFGRVEEVLKSLQESAKDPMVVASAAFAVAAIMGPLRALRTAAKVAAAASAARSVARAVRETGVHHG